MFNLLRKRRLEFLQELLGVLDVAVVEQGRELLLVRAVHDLRFGLVVLRVARHDVLHLVQFVEGLQTRN